MSPRESFPAHLMRRRTFLGLAACILVSAAPQEPAPDLVHLIVLHTNDVHGQVLPRVASGEHADGARPGVGGLSRVAAYVAEVREEAQKEGADCAVLVLDGGDWFQGTPEGRIDGGAAFVSALANVGYDAMCVGNHEFDNGLDALVALLEEADPPAVLANVLQPMDGRPEGLGRELALPVPARRTVWKAGLRITIVGLVARDTPEITHPDAGALSFEDPVATLGHELEEIGDDADLVLPLTHLGVDEDRRLARAFPRLPLIVGGHSHTPLREGAREGGTLIVQAGSKAAYVGRVDLRIRRSTGTVVESSARLVPLDLEPAPEHRVPAVDAACAEILRRSEDRMSEVVGELAEPLLRGHGWKSSSAGNWIADVFRASADARIAFHNRGGIRCDLEAGPLTRRELFELIPFDNTLVSFDLTGRDLHACLRRAVEGSGRTGLELSGLVLHVRPMADGRAVLERVDVGGEPLDLERTYRVATNSFLARGGDGYVELRAGVARKDHVVLLRDLLERAAKEDGPIRPSAEDRYRVLTDGQVEEGR